MASTVERPPATDSARNGGGPARKVDIAIIGSGFSGLGMAIKLKEAGFDDLVLFERGGDVGGTWWFNTYPGCQCDIPSHLYSFSFALNPDWSRTYSKQAEIQRYLRDVAQRFDVVRHVQLNTTVEAGEWDDDAQRWRLQTTGGEGVARVVIGGLGGPHAPRTPGGPGPRSVPGTTVP